MNIRTVFFSAALLLVVLLAARLVTGGTEVVSDPLDEPVSVLAAPDQSANDQPASMPSYRSRLGECFDVPVSEAATCQNANQAPVPSYRSRLDECFDVPVSELASCRNEGQVSDP